MSEPSYQAMPPISASSMSGGTSGPRASFWARLGAILIDSIILGIGYFVLSLVNRPLGIAVAILGGLIYFSYFEGGPTGQTLGKRALGIRVYDFGGSGGPIGYGRGAIRYLGRIISGIPCYLGYLWMLWDKDKQTWHDKIATTVVVPTAQYPVER